MSAALMDAIPKGDLAKVKQSVAEGADVAEKNIHGYTALLWAAFFGHIPIMHWLLTEGGSSLSEKDTRGGPALIVAAMERRFPAMQYLLEERGALVSEKDRFGRPVWDSIYSRGNDSSGELSSLLKVMVMLEDAPFDYIAYPRLSPQHADTRGRQLRAQLPSYLVQQRAAVVAHCPLPAVLQSIVAAYAATTPEDMWTDGLRVQAPRAKRARVSEEGEAEDEVVPLPLPRRSLRLRQKRS
jgi:hypothetical protein